VGIGEHLSLEIGRRDYALGTVAGREHEGRTVGIQVHYNL
jgi:hypothetical protein